MKSRFVLIILMLAVAANIAAAPFDLSRRSIIIDSLEQRQHLLGARADSIVPLRTIISSQDYDNKRPDVQLDIITNLANLYFDNDSVLDTLCAELDRYIPSNCSREAKLFVEMLKVENAARRDDTPDAARLSDLVRRYTKNPPANPFDRASLLFSLCTELAKATHGELLEKYTQELVELVESAPMPAGSVRNFIYRRAAPVYTDNSNHRKAVDIDRKMLNILDSLIITKVSMNEPYKALDMNRYTCYRRIMSNYQALAPAETEAVNRSLRHLADKYPEVADDIRLTERTDIYYCLATEQWQKAVEILKRQIDNPLNAGYRRFFLQSLVDAAEHTGDKHTQLEAALELNKVLQQEIVRRSEERARELQIINNLAEIMRTGELENSEQAARDQRRHVVVAVVLILVIAALTVLIVVLRRQNRRMRKMARQQDAISERLRMERNELRATQAELVDARDKARSADKLKIDFINNMSHEVMTPLSAIVEYSKLIVDCIPDSRNKYLESFAHIIELNSKLVLTLVNDVLDIASLEHGSMTVEAKASSIHDMCNHAVGTVFDSPDGPGKPGVSFIFNPDGEADALVKTDPQRVGQVLINMLSNADKFTDAGSITLAYHHDKDAGRLTFTVSDTGCGVPASQSEAIFSRFKQLDVTAPGCGLGLYISRLLAQLLGGEIHLDTTYRGGARFVFSIPV